eukprot:764552-Alexandrium_andersonii.AAC.1
MAGRCRLSPAETPSEGARKRGSWASMACNCDVMDPPCRSAKWCNQTWAASVVVATHVPSFARRRFGWDMGRALRRRMHW